MKIKVLTFVRENNWLSGMNHGWGNGYVVIFKGHPMYGKHYMDVEVLVDVHGDRDWETIIFSYKC